ncbi:MAG: WecB/TagA/CpsF family glycosyltransferase [Limisphaerales bacterium]
MMAMLNPEKSFAVPPLAERDYRRILGVRFFVGDAPEAVELGARGGLVIFPAAPALLELGRDRAYRQALTEADLVITDSGFLVLLWNLMMRDRIQRVSGLEYLELLLRRPEFLQPGVALLVMPSQISLEHGLRWLTGQGYAIRREDCYVAPHYGSGAIADDVLLKLVDERRPRHVIIGLGGGVQEKLGLELKRRSEICPAIHCIGAAIGFLSGDQVRIPGWADQWILGWLFRCASNPSRFLPRYMRALQLPLVLWQYRDRMPELCPVNPSRVK